MPKPSSAPCGIPAAIAGASPNMAYLIDSDILIYSLKGHPEVQAAFRRTMDVPKAISVVTFGELLFGARKSQQPEKNAAVVLKLAEIFPLYEVSRAVMEVFADLKAGLHKRGTPVDDMDLLIGATALAANHTLVTNNERHFSKIPGLRVENWSKK